RVVGGEELRGPTSNRDAVLSSRARLAARVPGAIVRRSTDGLPGATENALRPPPLPSLDVLRGSADPEAQGADRKGDPSPEPRPSIKPAARSPPAPADLERTGSHSRTAVSARPPAPIEEGTPTLTSRASIPGPPPSGRGIASVPPRTTTLSSRPGP